jgi:hypothetical protein
MCRGSQGRTSQGQKDSALHPTITTTAQHDCRFDGTPMTPWRREYDIARFLRWLFRYKQMVQIFQ